MNCFLSGWEYDRLLYMNKRYKAFTLIELIVVMGILIILLSLGIAIGRYAIQESQDTYHKDAVRNLYAALVKYKLDNKEYPELGNCSGCIEEEFFSYALGYNGTSDQHILVPYLEEETKFDGGSDATYYYAVDIYDQQFVIVCVSLGGVDDENQRGFYCTGDGIGILPEDSPILSQDIDSLESGDPSALSVLSLDDSDWRKKDYFTQSQ